MAVDDDNTWRVWQDPAVVARFADRRRGGLLGGDVQLETMLRLLSVVRRPKLTVLDLGCGDGILLETILAAFPGSVGVALDGSPEMLARARKRLGEGKNISYVEADFNDPAWRGKLPYNSFDAVVSGFAIHHSEDARKRDLYAEVYNLLTPGGVFINIEHVVSATPLGEEFFETAYAENVARFRKERGEAVTTEEVLAEMRARPDKAANRLAPVETQLSWLREIGFADVDCYWKHFELAVLAGYRPQRGEELDVRLGNTERELAELERKLGIDSDSVLPKRSEEKQQAFTEAMMALYQEHFGDAAEETPNETTKDK